MENTEIKKQFYEAPIVESWEVKVERRILTGSDLEATRNGYGPAESDEWD